VAIDIVDRAGKWVPDAVHVLRAKIAGPVELVGFGNGNPRGVASFRQPVAKTWHGQALAILRPIGEPGIALLSVEADGLLGGQAALLLGAPARKSSQG